MLYKKIEPKILLFCLRLIGMVRVFITVTFDIEFQFQNQDTYRLNKKKTKVLLAWAIKIKFDIMF